MDYEIYHPAGPDRNMPVELKRTSTKSIMCNDTYPKADAWYIIIHEKHGLRCCLGEKLLELERPEDMEVYNKRIQESHEPRFTEDGNVSTYARPNYKVDISFLYPGLL